MRRRCKQCRIHHFYPMAHRHRSAALQMRDATDVGAQNRLRLHLVQMAEFAVPQLCRDDRLQHAVSAGRTAAQMRFVSRDTQFETKCIQMGFYAALKLLAVLQSARRVKRHQPLGLRGLGLNPFL